MGGHGGMMSDVSQGPDWWLASDGKWYPPQSLPAPLPPPPPVSQDIGTNSQVGPPPLDENDSEDVPTRSRKGRVVALIALVLVGAVVALGVIGAHSNSKKNGSSAVATTAPSASPAAIAGNAYVDAYNTLVGAANAQRSGENGINSDSAATATAWNAEISARQTFDSAVGQIDFPGTDQTDARQVLTTDAALESAEGTLSANTGNIYNYNQVFDTVTPALNAFVAASTALENDLGLTPATPST